jgi:hypothetical protein
MPTDTSNQSFQGITDQLQGLIRSRAKGYAWVQDVYDDYCIYKVEAGPVKADSKTPRTKEAYFRQAYKKDARGVVKLSGSPVEVIRKVTYVPRGLPSPVSD